MQEYYEDQDNYPQQEAMAKLSAPCKHDYERQIASVRNTLTAQELTLDSLTKLLFNHGGAINDLSLKKMIGTAFVKTLETKYIINSLIDKQEEESNERI